ncbi:maltose:maltodextrin transport system permease [Clostridium sartagoforme AAU1]|uniref:Maltose/maltodextrin transport system permease protein n=1 Tax=Clostridium sartagoforme AAU1 TaxID=1202534 RepID=R9BSS9_9CLOT|nr:sugar ABC transporter permease [Clostridium sartagoforme]EOR20067.1 maltose:maltodextrin transport system permease [Clostridium sartagoforme AAU1]
MKRKKSLILSVFLWGSGQFFICKQRLKGLIIFALQILMITIELFSGYWLEYFMGHVNDFSIRLHGGFFVKGFWGIVTLGEKVGGKYGDHSTMLLINGVIAIFTLSLFVAIYIFNIRDAYITGKKIDETGEYVTSKEYFSKVKNRNFPYMLLIPIGIAFLFVVIMPIIFSVLTAFLNYNRDHLPPGKLLDWVGISNFKKLFTVPIWSKTFIKVLLWTIIWTLVSTLSSYFMGMLQAIFLNHKSVKFKRFFRTILILPWAIPQMISLLVFRNLLNGQFGPLNSLLLNLGIISENIPFLSDPYMAKVTVLVVNLWLGFPMFMVMMLGVFSNLDQSLYEAAYIDGAGKFQAFKKITLPLVFRATIPNLIMSMAANFNSFGAIYFLTQGGPINEKMQFAGDTDILISWIYKLTLNQQMYDIAAVMSVLLFIIIGTVSYWNFRRTVSFKEL